MQNNRLSPEKIMEIYRLMLQSDLMDKLDHEQRRYVRFKAGKIPRKPPKPRTGIIKPRAKNDRPESPRARKQATADDLERLRDSWGAK